MILFHLKKIILSLLILFILIFGAGQISMGAEPTADAFIVTLSIPESAGGTAPSGTSTFIIDAITKGGKIINRSIAGTSGATALRNTELTDGNFWFQLTGVSTPAGVTGGTTISNGDTFSSVTFEVRYWESIENTVAAIAAAQRITILGPIALSGNSRYATAFSPEALGYMGFEIITGVSAFGGVSAYAKAK